MSSCYSSLSVLILSIVEEFIGVEHVLVLFKSWFIVVVSKGGVRPNCVLGSLLVRSDGDGGEGVLSFFSLFVCENVSYMLFLVF